MSQTTIQKTGAIRTGSAKVEISADKSAWTDIGALRKVKLESMSKVDVIKFDNVDEIKKFSDGNKVKFSAELCEINFTNLAMLREGHITATAGAGSVSVVFADAGKLIGKYMRITNEDASTGNSFVVNLRDVTMTSNMQFPFIADSEADVMTMPVELEGYFEATNAIVDEQGV